LVTGFIRTVLAAFAGNCNAYGDPFTGAACPLERDRKKGSFALPLKVSAGVALSFNLQLLLERGSSVFLILSELSIGRLVVSDRVCVCKRPPK
jgi:hypothetical protein